MNKKWYIGLGAILAALTFTAIGCEGNEGSNERERKDCPFTPITGSDAHVFTMGGVYNHPESGTTGSDVFMVVHINNGKSWIDIPVLVDGPDVDNSSPSLSRDATRMTVSRRFKLSDEPESWTPYSIWILELGYGGELTQITNPSNDLADLDPHISTVSGTTDIFFRRTNANNSQILVFDLERKTLTLVHQIEGPVSLEGLSWFGEPVYRTYPHWGYNGASAESRLFVVNRLSGEVTEITALCD